MQIKAIVNKYKSMSMQVKASIWFVICAFLQQGISVIVTPIFTRLMNTAEYGHYSVFNSWYGIIGHVVTLNLSSGLYLQGIVKFESDRNSFSSSLQGLSATLVLFWLSLYLIFKKDLNDIFSLSTIEFLIVFVMLWVNSGFGFWSKEQRVENKYKKLIFITAIVSILQPILGIILVSIMENKVLGRILGVMIVQLCIYPYFIFEQFRKGRQYYSKEYWIYALKFCIPLVPHYLSMIILNNSDRIMIERLVGADEAGIYSLASSLSQIMTIFNTALMFTIEPWLYKSIKEKKIAEIKGMSTPSFILVAIINILLIAFAPEIVRIFAPYEYYDAIWVVPPIAMSVLYIFMYNYFVCFEFYYEKTQYITIATAIGAIINIILNYIFIRAYGYIAAGYTTLFCYIIYVVMHYIFMCKICKKNIGEMPYKPLLLCSISIVFMSMGFIFMSTYKIFALRIVLLFVLLFIIFLYRKEIYRYLITLIEKRKK